MPETTSSALSGVTPGVSPQPLRQEFPAARVVAPGAEATLLDSLVQHKESVAAGTPLEVAHRAFRDRGVKFMAVVRGGSVIGLCSRGQIGFVMGSRFGFALYSQCPVESLLVEKPLIVSRDLPVRELLARALERHGEEFHEEIVLVDAGRHLLGLIPVEAVAQLQSRLVAEQLDELRLQQSTLRQQNLELFRSYHALRQSKGLYLGLFESHTLGVALLDVQGRIHEHNHRLAELLSLGEVPALPMLLTTWIVEKDRSTFLALLEAQAKGVQASAMGEFTLQIPKRGARLFHCSTGWIKETDQVCACFNDITDQRALEQNMLRKEKQKLLDTLVGGIAHELNNKLTPVQGFAELLSREGGEKTRSYTAVIIKSVTEAANIIRQLFQLSKPGVPAARAVDLRAIVEETFVILNFQLRETRCEVRTVLPPTAVWVMADPGQLKQVALSLVLNAIQAMEGRPDAILMVETRIEGQMGQLIVTDNGCGIAPENLGRVFDPFFTTKGSDRGSGLGLSICFAIVRQHGGEIWAESQPDIGSCFTVSLPLENTGTVTYTPSDDNNGVRGPSVVPRDVRVLVVEDEEVVRRLLHEMLRTQFGCQVDLAANGAEALTALENGSYALVLSDIRMPVMNGIELYLHLRKTQPKVTSRFVFITGNPGEQHLDEEIAKWNVPVIAKPFTLLRFTEVCRPLLRLAAESQ